jgi:hypothetical protein
LSSQTELINGIVSLLKATRLVPTILPTGGGVDVGLTDGFTVFSGVWFGAGNATGETASALAQIQLTLSAMVSNATTTNTNAPTKRGVRVGSAAPVRLTFSRPTSPYGSSPYSETKPPCSTPYDGCPPSTGPAPYGARPPPCCPGP